VKEKREKKGEEESLFCCSKKKKKKIEPERKKMEMPGQASLKKEPGPLASQSKVT
jgi:hypothetical protein